MDPTLWQQVDEIFQASVVLPPEEQRTFLDQACQADSRLRDEVESLLHADRAPASLINAPILDLVAKVLLHADQTLREGQVVGRYRVVRLVGSGGMGEVYLARDTSLTRNVALKVLPSDFAADEDRIRRFQREAGAASALNHPNIITVYEVGLFEDRHFIATEFIEGKTLRQLMEERRLTLAEVLGISIQVASALEAAHGADIVHRDVKPENIMVRPDGYAKVLDFSLAKLVEQTAPPDNTSDASPLVRVETVPGLLLGTLRYMSPEQARGLSVDIRSDIFSFGVTLYEMLAGDVPFRGATTSDLVANILTAEPTPLGDIVPGLPVDAEQIVHRALQKDREARYQSVSQMLADLTELKRKVDLGVARRTSGFRRLVIRWRRRLLAATVAAITLTLASMGLYWLLGRSSVSPMGALQMRRVNIAGRAGAAAISPDGRYLALVKSLQDHEELVLRDVTTGNETPILRTNNEYQPTFSSDGTHLYFVSKPAFVEPALYRIPTSGGVAEKIAERVHSTVAVSPSGDRIAFLRTLSKEERAIITANADGSGERQLAVRRYPTGFTAIAFSPDGRRLACVGYRRRGEYYGDIVEIDVNSGDQKPIGENSPMFPWGDHVSWPREDTMIALGQSTYIDRVSLWRIHYPSGAAERIANDLNQYFGLSVTRDGSTLLSRQASGMDKVYIQDGENGRTARQITFGRSRDGWSGIEWTPSGRILFSSTAGGGQDIWSMLPDGSDQKQLTFGYGSDTFGLAVSADGMRLAFVSRKVEGPQIWTADIDGGHLRKLTNGRGGWNPFFNADGKSLYYVEDSGQRKMARISIGGEESTKEAPPYSEMFPRGLSPDGKLIAYRPLGTPDETKRIAIASTETGAVLKTFELSRYARPRRMQWSGDGKAITYEYWTNGVSNLMLLPIDTGQVRALTEFKEHRINAFAWSRDARYLAYSRGFQAEDLVLISIAKR